MRKVLQLITNNFPLKLASVLIAIVIWYVVVYNNNPVQTVSFQIDIKVENEAYIVNGKQQYRIDDAYKSVTVYVTGNRSQLETLTPDRISVVADLTQIVDLNRDPVCVPLTVSCSGFERSALELSRQTIPIQIENVASRDLIVSASVGSSVPYKDYEVGSLTPSINKITIYGPESIINNIDSVTAKTDVTDLSHDADLTAELVFIDKNQTMISDSTINSDIVFEGGKPDIKVHVELWKKKTDVAISVNYSGAPSDGYMVGTITTTPEKITVAGTEDALKKLANNNNIITIPPEMIDVSGLSADKQVEFDISNIMPENTKVSSSTSSSIIINIPILPLGSSDYPLDVDKIKVLNLKTKHSVQYEKKEIILRISGSLDEIYKLNSNSINASIDLSGYGVGSYTLPVNVELPEGCRLLEPATVSIHIKEGAEKE